MAFIGKQPPKAAITSSDITDGVVTADKLASDSVTTAKIADNGVTTAKINADAVTDAKIADDVVGSEHLTAGEVDTTALGADAVTAAKIADDAISDEHLDPTAITGQTAETSAANDDLILLSDTSASAALKKMTRSNFLSGVGGDNAPLFFATKGAQQNPSDSTITKVQYDTEVSDPSGVYDNSTNYRFTPGVAGYYYIFAGVAVTAFGTSIIGDAEIFIYKNGSAQVKGRHNAANNYQYWLTPTVQGIIQLDDDDYIEIYAQGDVTTSTPLYFYQSAYSWFGGYKLID